MMLRIYNFMKKHCTRIYITSVICNTFFLILAINLDNARLQALTLGVMIIVNTIMAITSGMITGAANLSIKYAVQVACMVSVSCGIVTSLWWNIEVFAKTAFMMAIIAVVTSVLLIFWPYIFKERR